MQDSSQGTSYEPHRLLDMLCRELKLKNDNALANFLAVHNALISKVRRRHLPLSSGLLLRIHELTAIEISVLKEISGDRRAFQRMSKKCFGRSSVLTEKSQHWRSEVPTTTPG